MALTSPGGVIKSTWKTLTGDSWGVDVRAVVGDEGRRYVTSYLSKYLSKSVKGDHSLSSSLHGARLVASAGISEPSRSPFVHTLLNGLQVGLGGWARCPDDDQFQSAIEDWDSASFHPDVRGHQARLEVIQPANALIVNEQKPFQGHQYCEAYDYDTNRWLGFLSGSAEHLAYLRAKKNQGVK